MVSVGKRSIMTLYSASDIESHRARIVMAEKGVLHDHIEVDRHEEVEDFHQMNPYSSVPTLIDRDLVLYRSPIIMEYLDERFPHPPLLPVYPVARAKFRLLMHRVENDWYPLAHKILEGKEKDIEQARKELDEHLTSANEIVEKLPYFMSEEFTMVDCSIAPILWRLPLLGMKISEKLTALKSYAERLFDRDSFIDSLTDAEREIQMD